MLRGFVRPKVPVFFIILLAVISVASYILLSTMKQEVEKENYQELVSAAQLMEEGISHLFQHRIDQGFFYQESLDPNQTGLIGEEFNYLTTTVGSLESKRTSTNPDFAALLVELFLTAGLEEGDTVAISASGSFPALLLATLSSCFVLGLEPIIIYSLGSSMYGANILGFTGIEMLELLQKRNILPYQVHGVTLGGGGDHGSGMIDREILVDYLDQLPYLFLIPDDISQSRLMRRELYYEKNKEQEPDIYVNIGGGAASYGTGTLSLALPSGLIQQNLMGDDGEALIFYYLQQGIPVINLINIRQLAQKNNIPVDPIPLPEPGTGPFYFQQSYPERGVFFLLAFIFSALMGLKFLYPSRKGERFG